MCGRRGHLQAGGAGPPAPVSVLPPPDGISVRGISYAARADSHTRQSTKAGWFGASSRGCALSIGGNSYLIGAEGAESKRRDVCVRLNMAFDKYPTYRRVQNTTAWEFDHGLMSSDSLFNHKRGRQSWFGVPGYKRSKEKQGLQLKPEFIFVLEL